MSKSPAMPFEYLPKKVFPILFPTITPIEIEMIEKTPIEIDVKTGETPVIPAPKPIVKQFIASTNPNKIDSFQVIAFASSNFGVKEE